MPPITIAWDSTNTTLTSDPYSYDAGVHGRGATAVNWQTGTGVDDIEGISIDKFNGSAYTGTQPSPSGASNQWTWSDPENASGTYEYTVSAAVSGVGVVTLDPRIINT